MFLNRLIGVSRLANVSQLSSELKKFLSNNFHSFPTSILGLMQKCTISSSPTAFAKLTATKSQDLWSTQKEPNPVERINEKFQADDVGRMFAVVQLCGKQFKVTAGDVILVEGYWEPTNGDQLRLDKVFSFILLFVMNLLEIF